MNYLNDPNSLAQLTPSLILAVFVVAFWKRDEKRDIARDKRISALEAKQDEHAEQYRELAERVADVVGQTKQVMEKVLEKLQ
jgi:hypothetical protein